MLITIFDLSFSAIPDLNKQAEDIDFFFQEYIRNYGEGAANVRLSNCNIVSVVGLGRLMTTLNKHKIVSSITNLTWLDLSFNNIANLNTEAAAITNLKGLRILYLHCNLLDEWNILDILKRLKKLSRLTLHCNPLAAKKSYRPTIIANLPILRCLDFSLISEEEKDAAKLGITAKFIRL